MAKKRTPPIDIFREQNTENKLRLLAAQKQLYSEAKAVRRYRILGSVVLALGAPFFLYYYPSLGNWVAAAGGIALLINFLLKYFEDQKVKMAATIQEEFDTALFGLPWNETMVGDKVMPEEVRLAAHRFRGNYSELRNWYADTGTVPYPLNVLLCQRTNLVWDWNLRRPFATLLFIVAGLYILALIIFAIATDRLVLDLLLALLFPALSAILEAGDAGRKHLSSANEKQETAKKVLALWKQGLENPRSVTLDRCREIQNCIYIFRRDSPLVPDWLYRLSRKRDEKQMYSATADLVEEAKAVLSNTAHQQPAS